MLRLLEELVGAGTGREGVGARAAVADVGAGAAGELVVSGAARDHVVAAPAAWSLRRPAVLTAWLVISVPLMITFSAMFGTGRWAG